jgi:hypothetical protein
MLLPPERFLHRDGTEMNATESQRALVLILTLDRCLKAPPRPQHAFTAGLMADAGAVVRRQQAGEVSAEELQQFYYWVAENAGHPAVPKATEDILRDFERLLEHVA